MKNEPNAAKIIRLFADIQDHLYNGKIAHELSQIARHTHDKKIIAICQRTADYLAIEINTSFHKESLDQISNSHRNLVNHLKWAKEKFDDIIKLLPNYPSKWTDALFQASEEQLVYLSQEFIRLDRIPDVCDQKGNEIHPGDLVAYFCRDEEGKEYEHYGVVMQGSRGYTVEHFFSGPTVQAKNRLVEKGIGYVHSLPYTPEWIFKESPPKGVAYREIKARIEESDNIQNKVWNKFSYNCEHWAREMVFGSSSCTQIEAMRRISR